jgi:hypothetical protein
MNLRDTLRLKPGTWVLFCHSQYSRVCDQYNTYQVGQVERVTQKGGVLLSKVINYSAWKFDWHQSGTKQEWVYYKKLMHPTSGPKEPEICATRRAT